MDPALESYQKNDYEKALEQSDGKNPILSSLARLKLNEAQSVIRFGGFFSKPRTDHLTKAIEDLKAANAASKGDQGLLAQCIADFAMDIDIETKISNCQIGEAKYYLGMQLYEKEYFEKSIKAFEEAKELHSTQEINKQVMLSRAYFNLGQFEKSSKALEGVVDNSVAYSLLSTVFSQKGDKANAETWINEAFKQNGNCLYARIVKAKMQNKPVEMLQVFEEYLKKDPHNNRLKRAIISQILEINYAKSNPSNGEFAGLPRGPDIKKCTELFEEVKQTQYFPTLQFMNAQLQLFNHNFEESYKLFEESINNNWEVLKCRFYMALILRQQSKYQEALEQFKQAMDLEALKDQAVFFRTLIYYQLGKYQQAIKELEYGQNSVQHHVLLAKIYFKKGEKQDADNWLNQAGKINSNSLYFKVTKLIFASKIDEAITLLEQQLKDDQDNWCLKGQLLMLYLQKAQSQIQIHWGEYAAKPKGSEVHKSIEIIKEFLQKISCQKLSYTQALLNYYLDQNYLAYQQFEECVTKNFQVGQSKYYQARISKDLLKLEKALDLFKQSEELCDKEVPEGQEPFAMIDDIREQRALIYLKQFQPDKATKEMENVKQGCQYFVILGQAMLQKGDLKQAEVWFNESLKLNAHCIYSKLAKASISQNQNEIIKILDVGIKQDPENYLLLWAKGKALNRLSKFELAVPMFDKPIQVGYLMAYASKAKSLRALKKLDEGIELLKKGMELCKEFPPFFCIQSMIHLDKSQNEEALKESEAALAIDPKNIVAMKLRALSFQRLGKVQEAAAVYQEILKIDDSDVQGHVGNATIAKENNDHNNMFISLVQLKDIVVDQKIQRTTVNPVVIRNARDLIFLQSEFERRGGYIEESLKRLEGPTAEKSKQELTELQKKKEEICDLKMKCIMQPLMNQQSPSIDEIMKRLNQLGQQVAALEDQNKTLKQENLLQSVQIEQMQEENRAQWDTLRQSGAYDKAKLQEWFDTNQGNEKYNYAVAFYWTLLSHIDAYRIANTNVLESNKGHTEDPEQKKLVNYIQDGIEVANKFASYVPYLGNICTLVDDVVDSVYSEIKNVRYANRIRSICKIVYENGTTEIADNLTIVLARAGQEISEKKDFHPQPKKEQTNFIRYAMKYFDDKVLEVKEQYRGKEIKLYESIGGTLALKDVITVLAYLSINYVDVIGKAKKEPLNKQIYDIIIQDKQEELLRHSRPVVDHKVTPLNINQGANQLKAGDIDRRDQEQKVEGGCCIIQ